MTLLNLLAVVFFPIMTGYLYGHRHTDIEEDPYHYW